MVKALCFNKLTALASLIHSFFNDFVMKRQVNLISKHCKPIPVFITGRVCSEAKEYTAIPYRVSTGPEQGFSCVLFPNREKPVFITRIPANGNRFFPVRKSTQRKPCFHCRDGFAV